LLICPTGWSAVRLSSPIFKNILLRRRPKSLLQLPSFRPPEGRIAIVTDAGWDAVDAAALGARRDAGRVDETCERSNGAQTNGAFADGKTVWS
jgi:hypothetical protein